ncbi:MAG: hypothetical protein CXT71_04855 [Methanobacteriota archaeon]|nr:MAG: hypothetical protein CXT71_04855 [Euryarchaeota archaeon]
MIGAMSYWVRPTTADIGLRAFARNASELVKELTLGMQSILVSDNCDTNSVVRNVAKWEVQHDGDIDLLVVKWLDEVLYRCEGNDEFLVDCQPMVKDGFIEVQVSFVDKNLVELEVEIKAVTTHEFAFKQVEAGQVIHSQWPEVPSFEGPGWYADVVFDI